MITKYFCEKCGKEFDNVEDCKYHELKCKDKLSDEKANAITVYGLDNLCDHCGNVYYVYGCEQDCRYSRTCLRRDKFPFWRPQKDEE